MIMLELTSIGIQVVLPLFLIGWLWLVPTRSRLGIALQGILTLCALLALTRVALWTVPPWWVPYVYLALWTLAIIRNARIAWRAKQNWSENTAQWFGLALLLPLGAWSIILSYGALVGRRPPADIDVIDMPMPLGPGSYLVANGGATQTINGHFLTLNPITDRQRAYRGQSFAVDLVKINDWGMRASGWRPNDPAAYQIFGEPVFSPCTGTVISMRIDLPDMQVPIPDETLLEGNHVAIDCGAYVVLLGHFKNGSVLVGAGEQIQVGQKLGDAGNSGNTFEPHLHIHVQRHAPEGQPLLSGEPLHIALNGTFFVRNQRIVID